MKKRLTALAVCALFMCTLLSTAANAENVTPTDPAPAVTPAPTKTPAQSPAQTPILTPTPTPSPVPGTDVTASPTPEQTPTPTQPQQTEPVPHEATPTSTPPAPTPTPTPAPTPTPVPKVVFSGTDALTIIFADDSFKIGSAVTAKDETGAELNVELRNAGGFDIRVEGEYSVVYAAKHPLTGEEHLFTCLIKVAKTPEQARCVLTLVLPEASVKIGDSEYSLLDGSAYALDENGQKLEVSAYELGGFNINAAGEYSIGYFALHPITGEKFTAHRRVSVLTAKEYTAYMRTINPLYGASNARYEKYLKYRDEVAAVLETEIAAAKTKLEKRVNVLLSVFPEGTRVKYARTVPVLLDDAELGYEEGAVTLGTLAMEESDIEREYTAYELTDGPQVDNISDILSVFVAVTSLNVSEPLDLYNLRQINFAGFSEIFSDMIDLSYNYENGELIVILDCVDADAMVLRYDMDEDRQIRLEELMQPEFQSVFASITGDEAFVDLTDEEKARIRATLPEGLDVARENVVMTAYSLVDKVDYFWGGKYPHTGWNTSWGLPKLVTSMGSVTTGKIRPFGMDCSGFVTWTFINSTGDESIINTIGNGSANQWRLSASLGWDEAKIGDLAFRARPGSVRINHVGIVASVNDDGTYSIVHCSSSRGGVVVTEAWSSGFRYMRRPLLYGEAADE